MSRPPQPTGGPRTTHPQSPPDGQHHTPSADQPRPQLQLVGAHQPPAATPTIRLGNGEQADTHYRPHPHGLHAIHTTRHRHVHDTDLGDRRDQRRPVTVLAVAGAGFLTTTGQRGTAAGTILARTGVDLDSALTVADTLDRLSGAALAAAGITDPDDARAVLAALWSLR